MLRTCTGLMRAASCQHRALQFERYAPCIGSATRKTRPTCNRSWSVAAAPRAGTFVSRSTLKPRAQYNESSYSTPPASSNATAREPITFVDWTLYRTKTALAFKVIKPSFDTISNGNTVVDRPGRLLLEFAQAVPGQERLYNWEQKLTIGLSAVELHEIMLNNPGGANFYHDPDKGGANEGAVKKQFNFKQGAQPGSYFFGISVTDRSGQRNISHSMNAAEFSTFCSLVHYLTPKLLGFDKLFE